MEHEGDNYRIVIGYFGRVTKGLLQELEDLEVGGRVETIQTTALLRSARILKSVLKTCHSNSSERPSAKSDVKKNSPGVNDNNNKKKKGEEEEEKEEEAVEGREDIARET